jgi:antitoxin MazE
MRISKWGNSLAVRIPQDVVRALDLGEGDEIELTRRGPGVLEVSKVTREQAIERLREYRGRLPEGYRFDRDEANAR